MSELLCCALLWCAVCYTFGMSISTFKKIVGVLYSHNFESYMKIAAKMPMGFAARSKDHQILVSLIYYHGGSFVIDDVEFIPTPRSYSMSVLDAHLVRAEGELFEMRAFDRGGVYCISLQSVDLVPSLMVDYGACKSDFDWAVFVSAGQAVDMQDAFERIQGSPECFVGTGFEVVQKPFGVFEQGHIVVRYYDGHEEHFLKGVSGEGIKFSSLPVSPLSTYRVVAAVQGCKILAEVDSCVLIGE